MKTVHNLPLIPSTTPGLTPYTDFMLRASGFTLDNPCDVDTFQTANPKRISIDTNPSVARNPLFSRKTPPKPINQLDSQGNTSFTDTNSPHSFQLAPELRTKIEEKYGIKLEESKETQAAGNIKTMLTLEGKDFETFIMESFPSLQIYSTEETQQILKSLRCLKEILSGNWAYFRSGKVVANAYLDDDDLNLIQKSVQKSFAGISHDKTSTLYAFCAYMAIHDLGNPLKTELTSLVDNPSSDHDILLSQAFDEGFGEAFPGIANLSKAWKNTLSKVLRIAAPLNLPQNLQGEADEIMFAELEGGIDPAIALFTILHVLFDTFGKGAPGEQPMLASKIIFGAYRGILQDYVDGKFDKEGFKIEGKAISDSIISVLIDKSDKNPDLSTKTGKAYARLGIGHVGTRLPKGIDIAQASEITFDVLESLDESVRETLIHHFGRTGVRFYHTPEMIQMISKRETQDVEGQFRTAVDQSYRFIADVLEEIEATYPESINSENVGREGITIHFSSVKDYLKSNPEIELSDLNYSLTRNNDGNIVVSVQP